MQQVSEYLAGEAGEDVTVYTTFAYNTALFTDPGAPAMPGERGEEEVNGVKVKRFPVQNRWGRFLYILQYIFYRLRLWGNGRLRMLYYGPISSQLKKAIKEFSPDIIAAAPFPLNHINYVFKAGVPVVLIGCIHTADRHGFCNPRIAKQIKRAAGYIALTGHEKEYLVQRWGIDEKKIRVIGVGLNIEENSQKFFGGSRGAAFQKSPPGRRRHFCKTLGIPEDVPVIAFVGQHGLHKGIETLILAMGIVWVRFPGVRLIVAGGVSPFTESFKELARFMDGDGTRIFFLDNIDESVKEDILSGCDIFSTPSGFESFGITILEAWKWKRPVVACRIAATMNLIEEYETGLLVDYKDARELAGALCELLADPGLREAIGEKGFRKLVETYSRRVVGKQYHDFYREVLGR